MIKTSFVGGLVFIFIMCQEIVYPGLCNCEHVHNWLRANEQYFPRFPSYPVSKPVFVCQPQWIPAYYTMRQWPVWVTYTNKKLVPMSRMVAAYPAFQSQQMHHPSFNQPIQYIKRNNQQVMQMQQPVTQMMQRPMESRIPLYERKPSNQSSTKEINQPTPEMSSTNEMNQLTPEMIHFRRNRRMQMNNQPPQMNNRPLQMKNQSIQMNNQPLQIKNQSIQMNNRPHQMINQALQMHNQLPQMHNQLRQMNNQRPQMNHQSPQMNHQPPQMNHQPPQMNHQSPQMNHQPPQMNNQRIQMDRQMNHLPMNTPPIQSFMPINNQIMIPHVASVFQPVAV